MGGTGFASRAARTAVRAALSAKDRAFGLVFPPQCLLCGEIVAQEGGLCGPCWRETPFILGPVCDLCGAPVLGAQAGERALCNDCHALPRPWARGRAVMLYGGGARRLILGLKHGDRLDLVPAMAGWMAQRADTLAGPGTLVAPVPAHRRRLLARRYNQAALLATALAGALGRPACPDLLHRTRHTAVQDGKDRGARFDNLASAVRVAEHRAARLAGRDVLLVDDVMTSGATLGACARACLDAGAAQVSVMVLARVVRDA